VKADSKQLRNFLVIVEQGSFTRAAEACNMSQPALSASIAQLERCLGVPVLDRGKSGATPNSYGRLLVRHARAVNFALEQAENEIALKQRGISGPLSIGGTPVAMISFIPRAFARLHLSLGPMAASLYELGDGDLNPKLRSEEIDVAVGVVKLDAPEPDIVEEILMEARYDIVVSPSHPLAKRKSISLSEVADMAWAVPASGGAFRRQIESLFATGGFAFPAASIVCGSLAILKEIVMATDCVAILPHPAIAQERAAGTLALVPLEGHRAPRAFGFKRLRDRELSPQAVEFIKALREQAPH
jgi:DNA-binding transcriptional LysR family regulator